MSDEWLEFLKTVDTPTLSNGIELLKIRPRETGFTPLQIRCFFPDFGTMCGYAVTAQVETVTAMAPFDRGDVVKLYQSVEKSPKPAVVVLQEIGGHPDYAAHCGEVMATFFTRFGAVGLLSDCAVRDVPEVRRLGFQYFARGTVASHANFRIATIGCPVQICGMVVRPGDTLHGDENGILAVPPVPLSELKAAIETIRSRERTVMDFVRGDNFTLDGYRHLVVE